MPGITRGSNISVLRFLLITAFLAGCATQQTTGSEWAVAATTPLTMTVEIIGSDDFSAAYDPSTTAVSWFEEKPCRIVVRAGMAIRYTADPATPSPHADFVDRDNSDTIAHELLHCLIGRWHSS